MQEIRSKNSGFHIVGISPHEALAEAVIPGEDFASVSMTRYEDPDFLACFNDVMKCTTVREKAVCLSEYLSVYPENTEIVDRAALQALPLLGIDAARRLLAELQAISPERNWTSCISYMYDNVRAG